MNVKTVATALAARGFPIKAVHARSAVYDASVDITDTLQVQVGQRDLEVVEELDDGRMTFCGMREGSMDQMLAAVVADLCDIMGEAAPAGAKP